MRMETGTLILRIVVLLALLWLAIRWFERSAVYAPSRRLDATPEDAGLAYEDVQFVAEDGVLLHGWWIPHPAARGTLIYCHGNGANIANRVGICADLHAMGVNVFIFDYRGYGLSRGWPTEKGTYRDARAAYEVVRARYADAENPPVVVLGASLGGAIAAQLATDKPVRGLIIESSFSSAVDVGRHLYPWLPVRLIARFRYDAASRVAGLVVPKLFASSRDDTLVPFDVGCRLYDAAAEPKQFVELRGPHDEGSWQTNPAYREALARFLDRVLGPAPAAPVPGAGIPSQ